jgi:peptide/nickel transport system substrate-binding protein
MLYTEGEDIDTLNPILTDEVVVLDLSKLTQGYLVMPDAHGAMTPSLALRVPTQANGLISRDGMTVTYELRRGVHWTDGAPFTAEDVLFSVRTILEPAVNVPSRTGYDQIAAIAAPAPDRVVITLKRPDSSFSSLFLAPGVGSGILPAHVLRGVALDHAAYNTLPAGLGPFRYVRWKRGDRVELQASPTWWGPKPNLQRITYTIVADQTTDIDELRTGELDADVRPFPIMAGQLEALAGVTTDTPASDGFESVSFNWTHPLLQDRRVREAIAAAIDRAAIVAHVNHGVGTLACSPMPIVSWAYAAGVHCPAYDPARAAALLDAAGWRRDASGIRRKNGAALALRIVSTAGNIGRDETVTIIQSALAKLGVGLTYVRFPASQLFSHDHGILEDGKYDLALYTEYWGPDPGVGFADFFSCANRAPQGSNFGRYCNPRVDAALADAAVHYDTARRRADYVRAQMLLEDDVPHVVLYDQPQIVAFTKRLTGIHPEPFGPFPHPWTIAAGGAR